MKHRSKTGNIRFQVQNISHSDIIANPILKPRVTARLFPIFLTVRSTSLRANTINLTESEKHEGGKNSGRSYRYEQYEAKRSRVQSNHSISQTQTLPFSVLIRLSDIERIRTAIRLSERRQKSRKTTE